MCLRAAGNQKRPGGRACQDCSECTFGCGGDLYAQKIDLVLPSGRTHYRTCAGSCVSLLVVLATLFFILLEVHSMLHENSFVTQGATIRNWYKAKDAFPESESDGALQVAFGIADLSDRRDAANIPNGEPSFVKTIPDSIGKLEAYYRTRERNQDGSVTDFK